MLANEQGTTAAVQHCPSCAAEISVVKGYSPWCPACNWNVNPLRKQGRETYFQIYVRKAGSFLGDSLLQSVIKGTEGKGMTPSIWFAYLIAGIVHAISLVILFCGIWLAIVGWGRFFFLLGAAVCLFIAWITRPRFGKPHGDMLNRHECPTLYKLVDEIADLMGAKRVDGIAVNFDYNATYGKYGLARKTHIHLGLPLVSVLEPQELVALLAHELGHGVNRDVSRGFFVGTAIQTLCEWHYVIWPERIFERDEGFMGILMIPVNMLLRGLAKIILGLIYLLSYLLWRNQQRAEFYADYLATTVSGLQAKLQLLEKLHLHHMFQFAMQKLIVGGRRDNACATIREQFAEIPASEIERVKRIERLTDARLDATHPPTSHRIEFLQSKGQPSPAYQLSEQDQARLAEEWQKIEERLSARLISYYQNNSHLMY